MIAKYWINSVNVVCSIIWLKLLSAPRTSFGNGLFGLDLIWVLFCLIWWVFFSWFVFDFEFYSIWLSLIVLDLFFCNFYIVLFVISAYFLFILYFITWGFPVLSWKCVYSKLLRKIVGVSMDSSHLVGVI